jgi:hypothetical protein
MDQVDSEFKPVEGPVVFHFGKYYQWKLVEDSVSGIKVWRLFPYDVSQDSSHDDAR